MDVSLFHPQSGDFAALTGFTLTDAHQSVTSHGNGLASEPVHGTTVIAVKFKDGVLTVGDRRATGGNAIMYDKAEKVLALDALDADLQRILKLNDHKNVVPIRRGIAS